MKKQFQGRFVYPFKRVAGLAIPPSVGFTRRRSIWKLQGQKKNGYIAITYSSPSGLPRSEAAFHHAHARSKKTLSCLPPLLSISHLNADLHISSIGP